jgi:hypothetical protein
MAIYAAPFLSVGSRREAWHWASMCWALNQHRAHNRLALTLQESRRALEAGLEAEREKGREAEREKGREAEHNAWLKARGGA